MMERMDKTKIAIISHKESEKMDVLYWKNSTYEERFQTVTFLRECFYGKEATTGRLQRFHTTIEYK